MSIVLCLLIPFIGTLLGAATVFFIRDRINDKMEQLLLGFASGVMIAASVWSLLIPSIEMVEGTGGVAWLPASVGFLFGIGFLLSLDYVIPHIHRDGKTEGHRSNLSRITKLALAVTLHNIPEGMAVGVVVAGALSSDFGITAAAAITLSIGIAIQNFPEGAIVAMPLKSAGHSSQKSFTVGMLSGIVEPIFAGLTIVMINVVTPLLPYMLSFAAGAMMYVVVEELIPDSKSGEHSNLSVIGVGIGFVTMMVLDVAFG